jgi:hypothetical protein
MLLDAVQVASIAWGTWVALNDDDDYPDSIDDLRHLCGRLAGLSFLVFCIL